MKAIRLLIAVSMVSFMAACATGDNSGGDVSSTSDVTDDTQSMSMDDVSSDVTAGTTGTTSSDVSSDISSGTQVDNSIPQETSLGASSSGLGR